MGSVLFIKNITNLKNNHCALLGIIFWLLYSWFDKFDKRYTNFTTTVFASIFSIGTLTVIINWPVGDSITMDVWMDSVGALYTYSVAPTTMQRLSSGGGEQIWPSLLCLCWCWTWKYRGLLKLNCISPLLENSTSGQEIMF